MSFRPGTVSKILWHFTGGPLWDVETNKQLKELKPSIKGYEALNSILESKEIRIGNYNEIVKIVLPIKKVFDFENNTFNVVKNYPVTIKSAPVCCIADIPLQHIAYHANRYGKIAIGFRREAIIKAGFKPVMYTLENSQLLNKIYKSYDAATDLESITWELESECNDIDSELESFKYEQDIDTKIDVWPLSQAITSLDYATTDINEGYSKFLAYIKTFDESEFDTIYCEREWRSIKSFCFSIDDIAVIILPREQDGFNYYEDFISKTKLPRSICIAAWEDLIEH